MQSSDKTTSYLRPFPSRGEVDHSIDMIRGFPSGRHVPQPRSGARRENLSIWIGSQMDASEWSTRSLGETFTARNFVHNACVEEDEAVKQLPMLVMACRCHTLPLSLGLPDIHGLVAGDYDLLERLGLVAQMKPDLDSVRLHGCDSPTIFFDSADSISSIVDEGTQINPALFWHSSEVTQFRRYMMTHCGLASEISRRLPYISSNTRDMDRPEALVKQVIRPHHLNPYHHRSLAKYVNPFLARYRNLYAWLDIDTADIDHLDDGGEALRAAKEDRHVRSRVDNFFKTEHHTQDVPELRLPTVRSYFPSNAPIFDL